ncbi:MAG: RlmE family RNA methyltransferase [Alphaproteobacteria bacterium]|nr:RlmE family RNA methyltransferase [Alphaproteobacteria bacterium]
MLTVRLKDGRYHTSSSNRWLERQLNDPYVAEAKNRGYRSRAAFKLIQLDEKYKFLSKNKIIVDLGCAPGGWSQIAASKLKNTGKLVGLDILPTEPLDGATFVCQDFTTEDATEKLLALLDGQKADIIMSDMAANTTGHQQTDHLRTIGLVEAAYEFAKTVLAPGGIFIAKVFQGGAEGELLTDMKQNFAKVSHYKPDASREKSPETYVVAENFRAKEKQVK